MMHHDASCIYIVEDGFAVLVFFSVRLCDDSEECACCTFLLSASGKRMKFNGKNIVS